MVMGAVTPTAGMRCSLIGHACCLEWSVYVLLFSSYRCLFTKKCVTSKKAACLCLIYFELDECLGVAEEFIGEGIIGIVSQVT